MDKEQRKKLREQYKTRKVVGGVYRIRNRETGRFYLQWTDDIQATRNWYKSCTDFGSCPLPHLQADWKQYGVDAFALEEMDLLEKPEDQAREDFFIDLKTLLELWSEKLPREGRY